MNLDNVQFFNMGGFETVPGMGENGLVRIPEGVRNKLNDWARRVGSESVGIEARFVTDSDIIEFSVSMQQPMHLDTAQIRVYKGNFMCRPITVTAGKVTLCRVEAPPAFAATNEKMLKRGGFAPNVWRIVFGNSVFVLHGVNVFGQKIRKPEKSELPKYNWLAYGSSITHSFLDGYPFLAAQRLKVQMQDKGLGGGCHMEKEAVDYLLDECEFDFITCELGINMREKYTPAQFEERARYLLGRLVQLGKPALIITTFPNGYSLEYAANPNEHTYNEAAYNEILVKLVDEAECATLRLVHGYELLDDVNGLSCDLIHPTSYGHAVIGMNLAAVLIPFLNECGLDVG